MQQKTTREQQIRKILIQSDDLSSSDIHKRLLDDFQSTDSLVTVKREVSQMLEKNVITASGEARARTYRITPFGALFTDIDAREYCALQADDRHGRASFNEDLFPAFPKEIFTTSEMKTLEGATLHYHEQTNAATETTARKELERLVIELSWKSSKIEGNTYTLLDTEKLIKDKKEAVGHDPAEATMILNHKDAFHYVREAKAKFKNLKRRDIEDVHSILIKDLGVATGLRKGPVGVLGSKYRPLDVVYQIEEAFDELIDATERARSPYAKALIVVLGISYLQPFEDGNKRTARLVADAVLMAYDLAPLSYRSVDEEAYREAMLTFYELNTLVPFKSIFLEQYLFAAKNYATK